MENSKANRENQNNFKQKLTNKRRKRREKNVTIDTLEEHKKKARNDFFPLVCWKHKTSKAQRAVVTNITTIDKAFFQREKKGSIIFIPKILNSFFRKTLLGSFECEHKKKGSERFIFVINIFHVCNFSLFSAVFIKKNINMCLFRDDKQCSWNMTLVSRKSYANFFPSYISVLSQCFNDSFVLCCYVFFK